MRILKLTPRIEKSLLARRAHQDIEAQRVASEIVADVRKRGDAALFAWTKKLDGEPPTPEALEDRLAIMRRGRMVVSGTPRDLKAAVGRPGATMDDVFSHIMYPEVFADLVRPPALERDNSQAIRLRERAENLLAHAVTKIFLILPWT